MTKRLLKWASCALLCLSLSAWAQVSFQLIPSPVGLTWSNYSLSRNGRVMAANYGGEIFRWTGGGGFLDLGTGEGDLSEVTVRLYAGDFGGRFDHRRGLSRCGPLCQPGTVAAGDRMDESGPSLGRLRHGQQLGERMERESWRQRRGRTGLVLPGR